MKASSFRNAIKQQKIFKSDRTGSFGAFPGGSNLENIGPAME